MNIINPKYKLSENNIFDIRQLDYNKILDNIKEILKVTEEIGFNINECILKPNQFTNTGELHYTIKDTLSIKLEKNENIIDLSLHIPKLIDGSFVYINGKQKIPFYQLFDLPIISHGKFLKIRNNLTTIVIITKNEPPFIRIHFLGKEVPLALIYLACNFEDGEEFINKYKALENRSEYLQNFIKDYDFIKGMNPTNDVEKYLSELGKFYTNYNIRGKGDEVVYSSHLMTKVDPLTTKFFETDHILKELINLLQNYNLYDDTNFVNKRIRVFEYMIYSYFSKVIYDFCMNQKITKNQKKIKFNTNTSAIISQCNVSDIVQFNFSINPVDELTKLSRTSIVGPGGFNKDNTPTHLRDIMSSMYGRICPVDTPDRENCGVLQNLISDTKLDDNLKFINESSDIPISIPVTMTPFLENDDQTRLQMATSQMRQAIMLKNPELPIIQSSCENLYTHKTQFVCQAKKDGEVLYMNNEYILVAYTDNTFDLFNVSMRKIYTENLDIYKVYANIGDKFKKGDVLAESIYCEQNKIMLGKNLLTAVMSYYGYNFEDGIVISDKLVKEGVFDSVHYNDLSFDLPASKILLSLNKKSYNPLPNLNTWIDVGKSYAMMKTIPTEPTDYNQIFEEKIPLIVRKKTFIQEINIYANNWNTDIPEFNSWVEDKINSQVKKQNELLTILKDRINDKELLKYYTRLHKLNKFGHEGNYKIKGDKINGIHFEISGIYIRKIEVGDKIGNRHGNKGVITCIIPHEEMPKTEDGRHVDICINPLGIISRMNIGQLYELHLAQSCQDIKKNVLDMLKNNEPNNKIKDYIINYIKLIDCTEGNWYTEQFINQLPELIDENFINKLYLLAPPFESTKYEKILEAMKYSNTKFEQTIYDPVSKQNVANPIAVGMLYFFRMIHIAENRLAARGIGTYTKKLLQPLGGRKNRGGQRCGEMETTCLLGHGALENLREFFTTKSDCIDAKNKFIKKELDTNTIREIGEDNQPESVKLLNAYLTLIGIDMNIQNDSLANNCIIPILDED